MLEYIHIEFVIAISFVISGVIVTQQKGTQNVIYCATIN